MISPGDFDRIAAEIRRDCAALLPHGDVDYRVDLALSWVAARIDSLHKATLGLVIGELVRVIKREEREACAALTETLNEDERRVIAQKIRERHG